MDRDEAASFNIWVVCVMWLLGLPRPAHMSRFPMAAAPMHTSFPPFTSRSKAYLADVRVLPRMAAAAAAGAHGVEVDVEDDDGAHAVEVHLAGDVEEVEVGGEEDEADAVGEDGEHVFLPVGVQVAHPPPLPPAGVVAGGVADAGQAVGAVLVGGKRGRVAMEGAGGGGTDRVPKRARS